MNFPSTVTIPDEIIETLAARVVALLNGSTHENGSSPWLTVTQAADYLQTTESAIRALVKRRKIPHHRAEGRVLFDRQELDVWVRSTSA